MPAGAVMHGKQRAASHTESDHNGSQKGHQGVSAADGCQCAGTKKTSDDDRIGNIVDLL